MSISGFTLIHNALQGGYPLVEAVRSVQPYVDEVVAVDLDSNDGTRELLERLGCRVVSSPWVPVFWRGREGLVDAYELNTECRGEHVIFFEADEVYDPRLLDYVCTQLTDRPDWCVWRLQLEMNFQRCRWYPTPVHRIFPRGGGSYANHPVIPPDWVPVVPPEHGFMWDIANCFRDNYRGRKHNQSAIWGPSRHLVAADHISAPARELSEAEVDEYLARPEWEWTASPFAIPDCLKPLVGMTKYHARI